MDTKSVINTLISKDNVKMYKNCKIKKATVTVLPTYTRVSLSLDKDIEKYMPVLDDDNNPTGEYALANNNIAFTSSFALSGILMETENAAFAANSLVESPKGFEVILSGASCDIIVEHVEADTDYSNPFSDDDEVRQFEHATSLTYPVNLKLSEFGDKMLLKLAEMMLFGK